MTDVAILIPMLGRPHWVAPVVASIRATTPSARVLFLTTPGDRAVTDAIDLVGCERLEVPHIGMGDYARKIQAGYENTAEPLLFLGAGDLEFQPGWLEAACAQLTSGIGVVGTCDCSNPRVISGEHSTHSLVTRDYVDKCGTIDGPGQVMFDGYRHEFVDDELVGTARKRAAYVHAFDSHVKHLHPSFNPGVPTDELYELQGSRMAASRLLFQMRRRRWR